MTHVLIVEDHEENRALLKVLLEASGYRVTATGDGLEALDAARRDPPDAIVSDVQMPKLDGFALCRAWMQDPALRAIPFIFYSATNVRREDEDFAMALGAVRYLNRPLEAQAFLAELQAVLRQRVGREAPAAAAPLDDVIFHTLHESALARKIEDKVAQLEAANRRLQESEARFRSLVEMSTDFYWETDAEHRLTQRGVDNKSGAKSAFRRPTQIGERRWEVPSLSPDAAGWAAYRRELEAHKPFREFEFSRIGTDGSERFLSIGGDPVFDASGAFKGYRGVGTDITARKRTEKALRASEEKFAKAFSANPMFVSISTLADGRYIDVNEGFLRGTGYTRDEIIGRTSQDVALWINPQDRQRAIDCMIKNGRVSGFEAELRKKSGESMTCEIWSEQIVIEDELCVIWITSDVSERKEDERKIHRLTQLYAALSESNQAIVRCTSEEELFPEICRAAVEFGGMKMAWIGFLDQSTRMVRIAARFGDDADGYLQGIEVSAEADSPYGRGPAGIAVRENRPTWHQDFLSEPHSAPWHERRARFGFRASASLPLHRNGIPTGVLTLYAGEVGAFDEAARKLLTEMAADIDFALDNFAREAARERAQQELRAAEEQFRGLVEQSIAGIFIIQDDKFAYVNPRFAEIFGYGSVDELIGRDSLSLVTEKDRSAVRDLRRGIEGGTQSTSYGFAAERKDGVLIEVGVHGARATHKGRPAVIGVLQDVSEKKRADEQIQRYLEQLQTAFMSTVEVATSLSEMRDPYTAGHERRVGALAAAIGAELGFDAQRVEGLRVAGFLHDIGKITIPAEILSKPGKLSSIEYQLIQGHPQSGHDVLKDVEFPWPVAQVALQHHERIDGSGYPHGLKGEAILFEARILAVADVVEAMSSHRPYRAGLGVDRALAEIERGRGTAYDAEAVDACLRLFRDRAYELPA